MSSDLAPDGLGRVQDFVNSVELPDGPDGLADVARASTWLRARGVEPGGLSEGDVRCLVEVREALRGLLEAHTGNNVEAATVVRLQELLRREPLVPVVSLSGASLAPRRAEGVDGFLAGIAAGIVEATLKGTWDRLKVCRADACRWAFYDRSKNARGHWCSMRVCGTREKSRTYRARRRSKV